MSSQSKNSPQEIEALQGGYLVRFNVVQVTVPNLDGTTENQYQYDEIKIETVDTRDDIINKIIASQYEPSAETALINNHIAGVDTANNYGTYQTFRNFAKTLADKVITFRGF